MDHYVGIDLHSNNSYTAIIDNDNKKVFKKKTKNDLRLVLHALKPYRDQVKGIVVESTYNWYWLVDGLIEEGYKIHLANPTAIKQYAGLSSTQGSNIQMTLPMPFTWQTCSVLVSCRQDI